MTVNKGDEVWLVHIGEDPVELYAAGPDAYDAATKALDEFVTTKDAEGFVDPGADAGVDARLLAWELFVEELEDPIPWRVSVEARVLG